MGYFVTLEQSTAVLPARNKDEALVRFKRINGPEYNHLKRGGSWGPGGQVEAWYSWMPVDYDKTVKSAKEVFELLGFACSEDDDGNVYLDWYDSKIGQEEFFLETVCDLMEGEMFWRGEDGAQWAYRLGGKSLQHGRITVVVEWVEEVGA